MTIADLVSPDPGTGSGLGAARARSPRVTDRYRTDRNGTSRLIRPTQIAKTRVAVIDGSVAVRAALPMLLKSFTFSASYATTEAMLEKRPAVEVVILEICGTSETDGALLGACAVHALTAADYRVCVYTSDNRHPLLNRCLRAGARGMVSKADAVETLAGAIAAIARGGTAISPSLTRVISSRRRTPVLTQRQMQVLTARARGETFHSIARRLEISERTAQDHWSAIYRRYEAFLRTHSAADLERSLGLDGGVLPLDYEDQ